MAKTISRFAMFEHADLTFATKKSCLNGARHLQPTRNGWWTVLLVGGVASLLGGA